MPFDFNYFRELLTAMDTNPEQIPSELPLEILRRGLAMIDAMTPEERANNDLLLDRATRERIARDAGVPLEDVNELIAEQRRVAAIFLRMESEE